MIAADGTLGMMQPSPGRSMQACPVLQNPCSCLCRQQQKTLHVSLNSAAIATAVVGVVSCETGQQ